MKKRNLIIIAVLVVVLVGMIVFVNVGNSSVKMSKDNLTVVTAPAQEEAMENEMFTEFVYNSPKMEGTNVALEGRVTDNGYTDVYPGSNAIDGDADGGSYWEGPADKPESVLTLNLKKSYSVNAIRIRLNPNSIWGKRKQTLTIEASEDGKKYTELVPSDAYQFDPKTGNELIFKNDICKDTKAKFLKLTINDNTGANAGQVAEFEVYTKDK